MQKERVQHKAETKIATKTKVVKKTRSRALPYVIIVVLLVILIAGGYYFYHNKKQYSNNAQQLHQKITANQQQISQLQTQLQQLGTQQNQLLTQIQQHGFSNEQWILTSANYLIHQAQLKLTVEHDVSTAIVLLQTAQRRVTSVNSVQLNKLAAAIDKDISDLQAIHLVDLNTLGIQSNLLSKNISTLSIGLISKEQQKTHPVTIDKGWEKAFYSSLHALRNVVIVQRTDHKFTPLLQQQQLVSFKQYLQNLAQQAFWGALNDDASLYHESLTSIEMSLQQYVLPSNKNSQLIQTQLLHLQKLKVTPVLPAQLSALIVVHNLQAKVVATTKGNVK